MLPLWLCIPFAGLLLCIAIMPLVKAEWWESHQLHAVIFWSLLFIIPFAITQGVGTAAETVLECIINDYLGFIVLLFGLFCVAGNISLDGDLVGSPRDRTAGTHCLGKESLTERGSHQGADLAIPACFASCRRLE